MPTLVSTYYKGKKMHGLRSKIWNHLTRFVPRAHRCGRSRFSEAEDARTHQFDFLAAPKRAEPWAVAGAPQLHRGREHDASPMSLESSGPRAKVAKG